MPELLLHLNCASTVVTFSVIVCSIMQQTIKSNVHKTWWKSVEAGPQKSFFCYCFSKCYPMLPRFCCFIV